MTKCEDHSTQRGREYETQGLFAVYIVIFIFLGIVGKFYKLDSVRYSGYEFKT